jgi:Flp pilus assembly protein TadD
MDNAWALYRAGDLPGAEREYRRAVEIDSCSVDAWYLLGAVLHLQRKRDEAEGPYRCALALAPHHADARNNLGVLLLNRRSPEEAADCFREVLRLRPEHADAHSNLGNALQMLDQVEESIACYETAIRLRPDHLDAHLYLGNALQILGQFEKSHQCYEDVIRFAPNHAQGHLCRALSWLLSGDFERGWLEHDWRFRCPGSPALPTDRPCWDGSPLGGKSILLYADHGLGDGLQFIRYARWVAERGGRTIVACQRPMERLVATCDGVHQILSEGTPASDFEVYAPVMSLPRIFGTTLATIPADVPYLFPDPSLVSRWRDELGPKSSGSVFKVGIAWQGNPGHGNDLRRSFRLDQLEPLARIPGVRLHSLQKGAGTEQLAELGDRFEVIELGSRLDDLMDTAALMANLDLIVTPDTSIAHLAGAIGAPAWVALPLAPDWRWLLGRDDSPWYPTLRLFRQQRPGDWADVFDRMARQLASTRHPSV